MKLDHTSNILRLSSQFAQDFPVESLLFLGHNYSQITISTLQHIARNMHNQTKLHKHTAVKKTLRTRTNQISGANNISTMQQHIALFKRVFHPQLTASQ